MRTTGLHLAAEVLINTPYVAELIRTGQFGELKDIIAKGTVDGMQTFDQALYQLYSDGHISKADGTGIRRFAQRPRMANQFRCRRKHRRTGG